MENSLLLVVYSKLFRECLDLHIVLLYAVIIHKWWSQSIVRSTESVTLQLPATYSPPLPAWRLPVRLQSTTVPDISFYYCIVLYIPPLGTVFKTSYHL